MNAVAYIGLGANLGDALQTLLAAGNTLCHTAGIVHCDFSTFYSSDPVDATGPLFVNAVMRVETTLAPLNLLDVLQSIENKNGRVRLYRNAPRTLDLDLLWYDGLKITTPRLTLPHPRMHLRAFVLKPLLELAPDLTLTEGKVTDLLKTCHDQKLWPITQV